MRIAVSAVAARNYFTYKPYNLKRITVAQKTTAVAFNDFFNDNVTIFRKKEYLKKLIN